jgi:ABC-type multidrug transport system fused ATPase/permease subunit
MSQYADRSTIQLLSRLLERKDRFRLAVSLVLILVGTFLEMLSLGIVIPVVRTIVGGDRRSAYSWLPEFANRMSYDNFIRLLMAGLVGVFVVKNVFQLLSTYFQQRVQLSINNRLMQGMFERYLQQPYEFHLMHSSSILLRNVQEYAGAVTSNGVGPALTLTTELLAGLSLLVVLVLVEPTATIVIALFFIVSSVAVIRISNIRTKRWGPERIAHRGRIMESLLAGFGGIKEIKIFGRDEEVVVTHRVSLYGASRTAYLFSLAQSFPRAIFEIVAVASVAIVVVLSSISGAATEDSLVILALFGVVAFRMLPSVNRIIGSVQQLSIGRAALEGAVESFELPGSPSSQKMSRTKEPFKNLAVVNVKYCYPNLETLAIDIGQLELRAGESIGVVGASGSGKSTLIDLLIGLLTPVSGTISMNGRDIVENPREWQDRIGYVPQHVYLMDTTIRRNVAFGIPEKSIDNQRVEESLQNANLWQFVQSLPNGWDTVIGERGVRLSGGQRQRLGIARALYGEPEVIVLDEATSALDVETEREIVESLREIVRNRTLIVVAHRASTLAYCSQLIRIEGGRIVQEGTFDEVVGSMTPLNDKGQ